MPGFVINGTGGPGPNHMVETRRKHRWVFETLGTGAGTLGSPMLLLLREATRPHPTVEEPVMHHNQEQAYFAGKHSWESSKLVWYDGEQSPDVSGEIWNWLNGVINISAVTVGVPGSYKKEATLQMLRGDGSPSETWRLFGCWPQEINWNTLDYTDTEIQTIEVTLRFDRAVRQ